MVEQTYVWRKIIRTAVDPFLLRIAKRMNMLTEENTVRGSRRWMTADPTAKVYPSAWIRNYLGDPKAIRIGVHSHVQGELLVFWDSGSINVGEWSHIAQGSRIWSHASISIGNHVLISQAVDIHDTNGHPVSLKGWQQDVQAIMSGKLKERVPEDIVSKPIVIEDDAWIDFKSTVLKGVHIGRGAIVMAGSVVVRDVPPWTIVAGNPAEVIRDLRGLA